MSTLNKLIITVQKSYTKLRNDPDYVTTNFKIKNLHLQALCQSGNVTVGQSGNNIVGQSRNNNVGQSSNNNMGQSRNDNVGQLGNGIVDQPSNNIVGQSGMDNVGQSGNDKQRFFLILALFKLFRYEGKNPQYMI